jgi:hypothetical protein
MKKFALPLIAALFTVAAHASPACDSAAAEKKLAGAAKTSFLKKCERESGAATANDACASKAAEKKLAGAAKKSFVTKCVKDDNAAPAAAAASAPTK